MSAWPLGLPDPPSHLPVSPVHLGALSQGKEEATTQRPGWGHGARDVTTSPVEPPRSSLALGLLSPACHGRTLQRWSEGPRASGPYQAHPGHCCPARASVSPSVKWTEGSGRAGHGGGGTQSVLPLFPTPFFRLPLGCDSSNHSGACATLWLPSAPLRPLWGAPGCPEPPNTTHSPLAGRLPGQSPPTSPRRGVQLCLPRPPQDLWGASPQRQAAQRGSNPDPSHLEGPAWRATEPRVGAAGPKAVAERSQARAALGTGSRPWGQHRGLCAATQAQTTLPRMLLSVARPLSR